MLNLSKILLPWHLSQVPRKRLEVVVMHSALDRSEQRKNRMIVSWVDVWHCQLLMLIFRDMEAGTSLVQALLVGRAEALVGASFPYPPAEGQCQHSALAPLL